MSRPDQASPPALDPLLSIDDLARVLNCGRRSVERMLSSGQLPRPTTFSMDSSRLEQGRRRDGRRHSE